MVQVIARYWNGCWGNWNRRWVWLEYLGEGVYQVRWRGGDYSDRDGRLTVRDSVAAVDALDKLLTTEVIGSWREIPT